MTLNIICEVKPEFRFHYRELAKKTIEAAMEAEKFPYEAEINLTLTDNKGIREINKNFRNIDRPTDVLSFPMVEYETPADFSGIVNAPAIPRCPSYQAVLLRHPRFRSKWNKTDT